MMPTRTVRANSHIELPMQNLVKSVNNLMVNSIDTALIIKTGLNFKYIEHYTFEMII